MSFSKEKALSSTSILFMVIGQCQAFTSSWVNFDNL